MNVLLIANGFQSNILTYLKDQVPIGEVHLISDSQPDFEHKNYQHFRDCTFGRFKDIDKYSEIPLDSDLLINLSDCESVIIKMMDRYQHSHSLLIYEERINLYHKLLKYWYNYLIKERIDVCVFVVIPHVVFDYVIYSLCKYLGVKTIMFFRLPVLPGKNVSIYMLRDIEEQIRGLKEAYNYHLNNPNNCTLSNRMSAYLDLKSGNEGKTFTGVEKKSRGLKRYFHLQRYIKYIEYIVPWAKSWLEIWGNPHDLMYRALYSVSKVSSNKRVFENKPDMTCQFIFVSLHYQPECTTSPMGGIFVHQDLMIDILTRSVPHHIKIYIKAHPRDGMSAMLFKRLNPDSRTVLIEPSLNSYDLIKSSMAVATITGTSGWEAFLNNKPVLMFGNYFYQDAPGVYKVKSLEDSLAALKQIVEGQGYISDDMVVAFLKAIDEYAFPGWIDNRYAPLSNLSEFENCRNIANRIAAEIALSASYGV